MATTTVTATATVDENIYDEIEIEDMTYDEALQLYHYPCPCGDRFEIGLEELRDGEEIAVCPSCSLQIRVIFDAQDLPEQKLPAHLLGGQQGKTLGAAATPTT